VINTDTEPIPPLPVEIRVFAERIEFVYICPMCRDEEWGIDTAEDAGEKREHCIMAVRMIDVDVIESGQVRERSCGESQYIEREREIREHISIDIDTVGE
jgi:hypothetical protein